MNRILLCFVAYLFTACSVLDQKSKSTEFYFEGRITKYEFHRCAPSLKWDGYSVEIEKLEIPHKDADKLLKFRVGKAGYKQNTLRTIKNSVLNYESLIQSTCITIAHQKDEKNILEYSKFRDKIFIDLVYHVEELDKINDQDAAESRVTRSSEELNKALADELNDLRKRGMID